jgi:hypothetical protein
MGGGLLELQLRGLAVRWLGLAHKELCAARDARWVLAVCAVAPAISRARHRRHSGRLSHCKHADRQAFCAIVVFQQFGARFKDNRGWQLVSFACGHDVKVDRPQKLAAALIAAA